ncbi:MAG: mismatch-specific DNA-glycosylase [Dehalococcoidia bacterium]|nr:mismatch-specific DNA-glycosylase [Dehalococcoidia bacterium]
MRPPRTLPDLLRPGLDLVFIGINPGATSALRGHYYAHPGNAFWRELSASGLTEGACTPADDRRLPACGIGFTDVVKRVVTDSAAVSPAELAAAAPALRARIAYARPAAVCFTSTRALEAVLPRVRTAHAWGRQPAALHGAEVWLMPSTSGRAAAHRAEVRRVLAELAARVRLPRVEEAA